MDPFTIAILAGLAVVLIQKRAVPAPVEPKPEPEPPSTKGITSALEVAGVAIVTGGIVAGIDAIDTALQRQEETYDWKHQIRNVLLSGDADHLFVTNPDADKGAWILRTRSRENLRLAYDFAVAIYPRPSGVHSPFVFSDAWGWYTDYYVRRWVALEGEIAEAKAAAAAPITAPPEPTLTAEEQVAAVTAMMQERMTSMMGQFGF